MKTKTVYLSFFTALAIIIHGFEYMIPAVTPWFKLGLANSVSLAVIAIFGMRDALKVAGMRILISSLLFGTFLSPAFALSLSGGLVSVIVMGMVYKVCNPFFSLIGISLIGAYIHVLAQGVVVYAFIIHTKTIFLLLPGMLILSLITGIVNGKIAMRLCVHMKPSRGHGLTNEHENF